MSIDMVNNSAVLSERTLTGGLILRPSMLDDLPSAFNPSDFLDPVCATVFIALENLWQREHVADPSSLVAELTATKELVRIGGSITIADLVSGACIPASVSWHARRVIEAAKARKIATAAVRVQQYANGFTGSDEDALTQLETFTWTELHAALDDAQEAPLISVSEAVTAYVASLTSGTNPEPLPTGLTDLDAIVRLMPGNFTVVAARPAVGKSVVALKMALSSAAAGNRVLFVSLEMSREEIVSRALAALSGLTIEQVTQGIRERGEHEQKILETQQELSRYPLSIVDAGGVSVAMIAAWVRKAARRNDPIRMLVVDYLQLLTPGRNRENRQVEVAEISRSLKNLARDSNAVVVGVAQVNRASEMRADKRPSMGDLRDSGQIEADADHILLLHRPDLYDKSSEHLGELSIHVAKNRHGSEGIVHVVHQFHRGTVSNLA